MKWAISKNKSISDKFIVGDIILIKNKNNKWFLKQYPKVNGGIVAIDPFTGAKALVGGFNFKTSENSTEDTSKKATWICF